jgi:hypothetical protein
VKVLHRKIKYSKHKMRVLPEPNVQKLILDLKNHLQKLGVLLSKFHPKKCPTLILHMEKEGGTKVGFKAQN